MDNKARERQNIAAAHGLIPTNKLYGHMSALMTTPITTHLVLSMNLEELLATSIICLLSDSP